MRNRDIAIVGNPGQTVQQLAEQFEKEHPALYARAVERLNLVDARIAKADARKLVLPQDRKDMANRTFAHKTTIAAIKYQNGHNTHAHVITDIANAYSYLQKRKPTAADIEQLITNHVKRYADNLRYQKICREVKEDAAPVAAAA